MRLFKRFKRGQNGFTLVELMVVMAIIAVMAAIVIPPVTGTKQVSTDSQVKQDASAVSSAVSKYNADANLAQNTKNNLASSPVVGGGLQETSNKWPETFIVRGATATGQYTYNFITGFASPAGGVESPVSAVKIVEKDGTTEIKNKDATTMSLAQFVVAYNAIDFSLLMPTDSTKPSYLQAKPNGVDALFETKATTGRTYNNYLWLLKKVDVETAVGAGRVVEVYSLITVTTGTTTDALTYQRVY